MTIPNKPAPGWLKALPRDRLLGEFSLWSADLCNMERDIGRINAHVDLHHIDVADGHFAPALLFFPDLVARIRGLTSKPLHVHLMVQDNIVLDQIRQFAEAGADLISIHVENAAVAEEALALIAELGVEAGMVLRIETPVDTVRPWLGKLAFVTLLGTAIGVKGQGLSDEACPRLEAVRAMLKEAGLEDSVRLAADGGIRENTVPRLRAASAETVVLGSLAFGAPDLASRMAWLHALPARGEAA
jgi:ribulose-phosphate 3-epimerase